MGLQTGPSDLFRTRPGELRAGEVAQLWQSPSAFFEAITLSPVGAPELPRLCRAIAQGVSFRGREGEEREGILIYSVSLPLFMCRVALLEWVASVPEAHSGGSLAMPWL